MNGWTVERVVGDAGTCHLREPLVGADGVVGRQAWWFEVDRPALVLGSAQPIEAVDEQVADAAGLQIVRRRSGGGAVLVLPGEMLWLDVVVPAGDPRWHDDVGRSMWWFGELWVEALQRVGIDGAAVHRGAMCPSAWSRAVCFDGLGPGEVTIGGRKAVGISQRRTRGWARLQSSVHLVWRPEVYAAVVRAVPSAAELAAPSTLDAAVADRLRAELVALLAAEI